MAPQNQLPNIYRYVYLALRPSWISLNRKEVFPGIGPSAGLSDISPACNMLPALECNRYDVVTWLGVSTLWKVTGYSQYSWTIGQMIVRYWVQVAMMCMLWIKRRASSVSSTDAHASSHTLKTTIDTWKSSNILSNQLQTHGYLIYDPSTTCFDEGSSCIASSNRLAACATSD